MASILLNEDPLDCLNNGLVPSWHVSLVQISRSHSVPSVVKLVGTRKVLFPSIESLTKIGSSTDHLMQGSEY